MIKYLFVVSLVNIAICNQDLSEYTKLIVKQEKEINMLWRYLKLYSNIKQDDFKSTKKWPSTKY